MNCINQGSLSGLIFMQQNMSASLELYRLIWKRLFNSNSDVAMQLQYHVTLTSYKDLDVYTHNYHGHIHAVQVNTYIIMVVMNSSIKQCIS